MNNLRIIELFGGIGACTQALKQLNIPIEVVDYVEIDKYAVASYNAINGTNFEPQDITTWDKDLKSIDLIMHGSPCQDFSIAGKQAGGDANSGTRSSLMYETIRIVSKIKPKYVIWENVKNLLSKKHKHNFDAYLQTMEQLGYTNYYQVLNAKDYGIPQNRERVFVVSILGNKKYEFPKGTECNNRIEVVGNYMPSGHNASRIVDENGLAPTVKENHGTVTAVLQRFEFPPKQELKLRLKDMLEENVDEKYYLSDKQIDRIKTTTYHVGQTRIKEKEYCDTLCARDWKDPKCVRVGGIFDTEKSKHQAGSIYDKEGLSPTLDTMEGGWRQPSIIEDKLPGAYGRDFGSKGKTQRDICSTLQAAMGCGGGNIPLTREISRIRKLTPKECWRLMGFSDIAFEKAEKVNSNTQLYKQAGNSIVVNVLTEIFKKLFAH